MYLGRIEYEYKVIEEIVREASIKVSPKSLDINECVVGLDHRVEELKSILEIESKGEKKHEMKVLNKGDPMELFCQNALKRSHIPDPERNYDKLSNRAIPFQAFEHLTYMNVSDCHSITQIPNMSGAKSLKELRFDRCEKLDTVDESVGFLLKLVYLNAFGCSQLRSFVPNIYLPALEHLSFSSCRNLENFPEIVEKMYKPLKIYLINTSITELPHSIGNLIGLEYVHMANCRRLQYLPSSLFMLPNVVTLKVGGCSRLPESFRRLEVSNNSVRTLHYGNVGLLDEDLNMIIHTFPNLEDLDLSGNHFVSFPARIQESICLTSLDVDDCVELQEIPKLPPSVQKVNARQCNSLNAETLDMLWFQVRKKMKRFQVIMPGSKIPEWFDRRYKGGHPVFKVRRKFPVVAVALVWEPKGEEKDSALPVYLHLLIGGRYVTSKQTCRFFVACNHVLLFDLRVMLSDKEWEGLDARLNNNDWKIVHVLFCSKGLTLRSWGVYVYKQETNMDDIRLFTTTNPYDHHTMEKKQRKRGTGLDKRPSLGSTHLRANSSESDGRNASEDKHVHVNDGANLDKGKNRQEMSGKDVKCCNANSHARLGEQDQEEWLNNVKLSIESKKRASPLLTRRDKFKNQFLRRIVPWEKINISWDTFPYHINEHTKNLLVECAASHLRRNKFALSFGTRLASSSGRILLQSIPGTELYRERVIRALAQHLQVTLLVLDSSIIAPYDIDDDISDGESDDDNADSGEEGSKESKNEDDNDASSSEIESVGSESSDSSRQLRKGDRVKYIGPSFQGIDDERPLNNGQRGEVYEANDDRVAVILDINEDSANEGEVENLNDEHRKPAIYWIDVEDIEYDLDAQTQDCYIAVEALCEVLKSRQPLIVYFTDSSQWFHKSVPKSNRNEFLDKVEEMFDKLSGPLVLICGQSKVQSGSKEFPLSQNEFKEAKRSEDDEIHNIFSNVLCVHPPEDYNLLAMFKKQLDEDRKILIARSNFSKLQKVLEEHQLSCTDILHVNTDDVILTKQKAEKVVGWAKNHYLSSCPLPSVKGKRLCLPRESLEIAISRMKGEEIISRKPSQILESLAKDEFERNFISAVVPSDEIGVKFDDIGALEVAKKALNELVILPMRRPELFSRGNLLRPCKGILLFGPPGTGKTLMAKALATEAGANFISITGSTLTSKWFGDAEKLTKALFSFASKLAPVIIFVDEIDSLLGARGGASEHEATRRMTNEFMAAWDGLRSKENQRILILGATNRPFDLDNAVIRRLPRRIYVDLPDAENRMKILRIVLAQENLVPGFEYGKLAELTEGYSGSDLKNLCIAAAYGPVQELIEEEKKGGNNLTPSVLRPLNLVDFVEAKAKVGPSVACDARSMNELRKWNEMYGEGGSRTK